MQLNNKHRINDIKPFGRRLEGYHFVDSINGRSNHIYTGEYYSKCLSDRHIRLQKVIYSCMSVTSLLLFFLAGSLPIQSNTSSINVLLSCGELLLFLWLLYIIAVLITQPKRLTVWGYRITALQLQLCTMAGAIALILSAAYALFCLLCTGDSSPGVCILACISYFSSGALLACITISEHHTTYDVELPV